MIAHLLQAFRRLFTTAPSRLEVAGLILVMAAVPVVEMLVIRMFAELIIAGPDRVSDDLAGVARDGALFFVAFAAARGTHHLVRVARVTVFRKRFDQSQANRSPSQQSWDWALAFELSNVLVSMAQVVAFSLLFLYLDLVAGAVNVLACGIVLTAVSWLYRRQIRLQRDYVLMGSRPGTTAISQRVGGRIRAAELGSFLASLGMVAVLVCVLVRTLLGDLASADAIVFFLGLRLLYGQVGTMSSGIMRFARAAARGGM